MLVIEDLDSLYKHIEENAFEYVYEAAIAELFKACRDNLLKVGEKEGADIAQVEVDTFHFVIRDGEIFPMWSWTDDKGMEHKYPDIGTLTEKALIHLIYRVEETNNPRLKARYAHILWESKKRNIKYARIAVDSYLASIKEYEEKDKEKPSGNYGIVLLEAIQNCYDIGSPIKYRLDDIKSKIIRLTKDFNNSSSSKAALTYTLLTFMMKEKKIFTREDFIGLDKICTTQSRQGEKDKNIQGAIDFLELGEKVELRLGKKTLKWRKEVAALLEKMFLSEKEKNGFAAMFFCQRALEIYRSIRNDTKVTELEREYKEISRSVKYTEFSKKIDLSDIIKKNRDKAETIVKKVNENIVEFLIKEKRILPTYKEMMKWTEKAKEDSFIRDYVSEVVMNSRGLPVKHYDDKEEKREYRLLENYRFALFSDRIYLIREIFLYAIKEKVLSTRSMLEYMMNHTWYGKSIAKKTTHGEKIIYNWLNIIAPSINEYFINTNIMLTNPGNRPNFVLSIDSLTLKIEGLVRDICDISNVPTILHKKDHKGRPISIEKHLAQLLSEKKIKELFDEDDLLFFKYLLVEQAGLNIRNKVAHSLMDFRDYSFDIMNMLILALLRLGKYDFVKSGQAEKTEECANES